MTHPITTDMDIFYCGPAGDHGWTPVEHMARLAAKVFGGRLHMITERQMPRSRRMWLSVRPRFKSGTGSHALYIARTPIELANFMETPDFHQARVCRAAWVVDSFWTEWCPPAGLLKHYDLIAHMQHGETGFYNSKTKGRSHFLGWGADVLGLAAQAMGQPRDIDILRVGRQPAAWENDEQTATICDRQKLRFHGRPPYGSNPDQAYADLMRYYGRSKYIIAHSNLVDQTSYTHVQKDYMTARWTDALACGAMVAGKPPFRDSSVEALLWPSALLPFEQVELEPNIEQLKEALKAWTPAAAQTTHLKALQRLDWRWRFAEIAKLMGVSSPTLDANIAKLDLQIAALTPKERPQT